MQRRQELNVPTEIVRTLVNIAETGSFSAAAQRMGLSQPAVTAQMKRLQGLIGGPIFDRAAGGITFSARGKLVLEQARKILDANNRILSFGGAVNEMHVLRIGISPLYLDSFLQAWKLQDQLPPTHIYCDQSEELLKGVSDGFIDIACCIGPKVVHGDVLLEWEERYVWVRSPDFYHRHGQPLPLITSPAISADHPMIRTLERSRIAYYVAFESPHHYSRLAAIKAGIGFAAIPERVLQPPLIMAPDIQLPRLEPLSGGICLRMGAPTVEFSDIIRMMGAVAEPRDTNSATSH